MSRSGKPRRLITAARPCADIGRHIVIAREINGMLQKDVAKIARMRQCQVSRAEAGFNVEAKFYLRIAQAMGYESVMDMLEAWRFDEKKPRRTT